MYQLYDRFHGGDSVGGLRPHVTANFLVVVGGNETRSAGIWYSDGGELIPADIDFPAGVNIGQEVNDYRLADGIEHLEALPDGRLVAWQPVQRVTSSVLDR